MWLRHGLSTTAANSRASRFAAALCLCGQLAEEGYLTINASRSAGATSGNLRIGAEFSQFRTPISRESMSETQNCNPSKPSAHPRHQKLVVFRSPLERCNLLPAALEEQRLKIEKSRAAFFARYGDVKKFVEGRVVDFTDLIRHGDSANPDPRVKSLYELSEKLFPIEDERETPEGLEAYVRPDHLGTHPRNERRIIAILNEDETKVIGAAIYGVAATPEALREETGIDGVVGLTYAMVD
jgi:hypothetical protein